MTTSNTLRVERLNKASLRRVIEPDVEITGTVTKEQVMPDDLLSVAGLGLDLTPQQRARLSREEVASIVLFGINFEAVLMAGFAFRLALGPDVTDPRFTYALHEIGEETRHSRLFIRLYQQLAPQQRNPFIGGRWSAALGSRALPLLMRRPATLDAFVLTGEEIPDLFQKLLAEDPDTDEFIREVNRYHRAEEARHLAFARTTIGEHYATTTWTDRFAVRWIVPLAVIWMFDIMVQPYVYETVDLPPLRTWLKVRRQPRRTELRRQVARSVLKAIIDAGAFRPDRIPPLWRRIAGPITPGSARC